jgi:hypothetical protein
VGVGALEPFSQKSQTFQPVSRLCRQGERADFSREEDTMPHDSTEEQPGETTKETEEIVETVHLQQTGVQHLVAQEASLEETAVGKMSAGDVNCNETAIGFLHARSATLGDSMVNALTARQVFSDEGIAAGIIAAHEVEAPRVEAKVLLAGEVKGDVTTLLDTPTALLAGAAAGVVFGLLAWLLRKR